MKYIEPAKPAELPTDQWIRCHVHAGDLLVLPAGIYHRFTLDCNESVKMMRLFKVRLPWLVQLRSTVPNHPHRTNRSGLHITAARRPTQALAGKSTCKCSEVPILFLSPEVCL